MPPKDGPFEEKVREIFSADFLSPVLAAALFPDLLQRVLPFPVPSFDRAKALDATLEEAWQQATQPKETGKSEVKAENPLKKTFLDLWTSKNNEEAVPALILNATEVANGYRTFFSPLYLWELPTPIWLKAQNINQTIYRGPLKRTIDTYDPLDVKLSTAAGISARFPFILPAASIKPGDGRTIRLVDGGYVESSATEIANDIIQVLKGRYRTLRDDERRPDAIPKYKFYLIVLMGLGFEREGVTPSEVSVPPSTLISTWSSRADQTFIRAYLQNCAFSDRCFETLDGVPRAPLETDVAAVFLNLRDFNLPLTWQLTRASQKIISLHAGAAWRCVNKPTSTKMLEWTDWDSPGVSESRVIHALEQNDCSSCLVQYKLAKRSTVPDPGSDHLCRRWSSATGAVNPQ